MRQYHPRLKKHLKIALAGNPNCGKTSLFNALTGLRQKVANYPGVTVDKKTGECNLDDNTQATIIDLPGTYSLYPKSLDEYVAFDVLLNKDNDSYPDVIIVVADAANLKRNLLFCSQIIDLKIPVVIALNMLDVAHQQGHDPDIPALKNALGVSIVPINARKAEGVDELKRELLKAKVTATDYLIDLQKLQPELVQAIRPIVQATSDYATLLTAHHYSNLFCLDARTKEKIKALLLQHQFKSTALQGEETLLRYEMINRFITDSPSDKQAIREKKISKLDHVLTHYFWGYLIFIVLMFVMFQLIFTIAAVPMDWIDNGAVALRLWISKHAPDTIWIDLLNNGIIAGLSGVVVFIPQIMLLFGMITILEDTGYMSRVSFMMDKLMRKVGMNGRSVVPLMSGMACAVPAIMSARTIENRKDRLITLLVTPLMSCSARIPVYTLLVSMMVPKQTLFGIISLQGLIMLGMYFLGFITAIIVAFIFRLIIKQKGKSYFIMELPVYRMPRVGNILITMYEKAKIFTFEAGKIILTIAIILWVLASFGPSYKMHLLHENYTKSLQVQHADTAALTAKYQSEKLATSYAGELGKSIEPLIKPLGFDWKIGIALITSFAAREVFVGTMSTLYSVGNENDTRTLKMKLSEAKNEKGEPIYSLATLLSLLIFYAFAMQCISTVAVVKRESGSWWIPIAQILYMTGLAYLCSCIIYQVLK